MSAPNLAPGPSEPALPRTDREPRGIGITEDFAATIGWDPSIGVVTFPPNHPTLGGPACRVPACERPRASRDGLCWACIEVWRQHGEPDFADYLPTAVAAPRRSRAGCTVAGCARPWTGPKNALCQAHHRQRVKLQLTLEQFLAQPAVVPRESLGLCQVKACTRDRMGLGRYCTAHDQRWRKTHRAHPRTDRQLWEHTSPGLGDDHRLSLRGLPEQVVAEFLTGLQRRSTAGMRTATATARLLLNQARAHQVSTLAELPDDPLHRLPRRLRNTLLGIHPLPADDDARWSLRPMGHAGSLRFGRIRQPWLQEATQAWAIDQLPRRRGSAVAQTLQQQIESIVELSDSLHRHRDDHGHDRRDLGRADVVAFLNQLAYKVSIGELSEYFRIRRAYDAKRLLRRMRSLGLTRPGQPMHDLPEDFALSREDMPALLPRPETGRDLPPEVVAALVAHLDTISGNGHHELRTAIELLIDTGRRPNEICTLAWDCLHRDPDGKPVLIYDNHKAARMRRRLQIPEATAATITAQQRRVRERFPDVPTSELMLLPTAAANADRREPISSGWLSERHRHWVDALPELTAATDADRDGRPDIRGVPFAKEKIIPHAWRHTYAQRHADAGVDVRILAELMDHTDIRTTQGYYRVSDRRRRDAVDRVAAMQFDRRGNRIWRKATALMDSERLRRAIGEVAVPYGTCTEPTNVAAGGQDCPVRYRCVGCGHFRTDVSYLPDLQAYLADLLRHRERLLATTSDIDDWAKAEAMPSTEEITQVRALINRIKNNLHDLDESERSRIEQAADTVRATRHHAVSLGLPTIRPPLPTTAQEPKP